jgi:HlyD family secretion protein
MGRRGILGLLAVVTVLSGAAWALSARGNPAAVDPSRIATVEAGTMVRSVVATGKIQPITTVEIKSKANGIIEHLLADVDDVVEAGQVLTELDKKNLSAQVREARANLQAAEAAHEAAIAQLRKNEIEAETPDVEFARRNASRAEQLFADQLVAQSALDEARTTLEQATNRQRAAQGQLLIAKARVGEAEANVAQAKAAVERAEEELANATIRAPIRATVLTRDVEVGSRVFMKGKVDEADIGKVRLGQAARITTESFPDRVFEGRIIQISPVGVEKDNVTTFEVEASIENPGKELKANMTANAEVVLEEIPDSLLLPEAAIVYDQHRRPFVDLIDATASEGRRRVPVKVGAGNGTRVQILEGVRKGDRVVLPG